MKFAYKREEKWSLAAEGSSIYTTGKLYNSFPCRNAAVVTPHFRYCAGRFLVQHLHP
jgi:hypothetical protein